MSAQRKCDRYGLSLGRGIRAVMETLCFVCWLVVGRVFMAVFFFGKGVENRVGEYGMIVI